MSESNISSSSLPAYPLTPLSNALAVAEAVSKAGGTRTGISKAQIAHVLGCSDASGAFIQRLSSARSWGIIDGRGTFRLTRDGERYLLPTGPNDRRRALLRFLATPPIFAQIIKTYDGSTVPAPENLANLLQTEFKISEAWKGRVANFFNKAADIAQVVDARGYLRYRATLESMEAGTPVSSTETDTQQGEAASVPLAGNAAAESPPSPKGGDAGVLTLDGVTVRVQTSGKLSLPLWNLLNSYVQALKPSKGVTGT